MLFRSKNRDTLIQVDGRRPRVPIDTLVRISDEKYYKENKAPSWDDSFERTQCLPSWRQEN